MELVWLILGVSCLSLAAKHDGASSSKSSAAIDRDEAQRKKIERAIHSVKEKLGDNITLSRLLHVLATRRLFHDIRKRKKSKKIARQRQQRREHTKEFRAPMVSEQSSAGKKMKTKTISSKVQAFKPLLSSSSLEPEVHELFGTGRSIRNKTRPTPIHDIGERSKKDNEFWQNSTVSQESGFAEGSSLGYLHNLPSTEKVMKKDKGNSLLPDTQTSEGKESSSGFYYNDEDLHEGSYDANKEHYLFDVFGNLPSWYQFDKRRKDYIPRPPTKTEPAKKKSSFSFSDSDVSSQMINTENGPLFDLLETIDASDAKQIADLMRKEQSPEIVTTDLTKEIPSLAREGNNLDIFTSKSSAYYNVPVSGKNIRPHGRDPNNAEIMTDEENLVDLLENAMQRHKLERESNKLIKKEGELQKLRKVLAESNEVLAAKIKQKQRLLKMLELRPQPEQKISTNKGLLTKSERLSPKVSKINQPGRKGSRLSTYQQPVVFASSGKQNDAKTASMLLMSALDSATPIGPVQKEPRIDNEPNSITMADASGRPMSSNKPVRNSNMALKKAQSALKASLKFVKQARAPKPLIKNKMPGNPHFLNIYKNASQRLQNSRNFPMPSKAAGPGKHQFMQPQAKVRLKPQQNAQGRQPQNLALNNRNPQQRLVSTTAKIKVGMKTTERPGPEMEEGRNGFVMSPKDVTGIRKTTDSFIGKVSRAPFGKASSTAIEKTGAGQVAKQRPMLSPIRKPNPKSLGPNLLHMLTHYDNSAKINQEKQNGYSLGYPLVSSRGSLITSGQRYLAKETSGTRLAQPIAVIKAHQNQYSPSGWKLQAYNDLGHLSATANKKVKPLRLENGIRKEELPTPTLPIKPTTLKPGSWKVRDYYLPGDDKSSWEKAQSLWTTHNGNMFRFDNAIAYHPNDKNGAAPPMVSVVNGPPIPTMPLLATGMFGTPHMLPQMNEGLQDLPMMPTMSPVYGPTPMTMPPWQWFKDQQSSPSPSPVVGTRSSTRRKPTMRQQPVQTTARELSPTNPTSLMVATSQSATSPSSQAPNSTLSVSLQNKTKNGSKPENDTESGLVFDDKNNTSALQSNATTNGGSVGDTGYTEGLLSENSTKVDGISPESWKEGDIQNLYFDNTSYPNTTVSGSQDISSPGPLFTLNSKPPIFDGKNKPAPLPDKPNPVQIQNKEAPGMSPGDMQTNHPEQINKKNNSMKEDRSNLLSYELVGLTNNQQQSSLPQFPPGPSTINTNGIAKDRVYHSDYYGQPKPWELVNRSPDTFGAGEPDVRGYDGHGIGNEASKTRSFESMEFIDSSRRDIPLRGDVGKVFPISDEEDLPDVPAIPTDTSSLAPFARKPVTSTWPKLLPHLVSPTISSNQRATMNAMEAIHSRKGSSWYTNPPAVKELTPKHNGNSQKPFPQLQRVVLKDHKGAIATNGRQHLSSASDHRVPKFREFGSFNRNNYANNYFEDQANVFDIKEKEGYVSEEARNGYNDKSYQLQSGVVKHLPKPPSILAAQQRNTYQREAARKWKQMYHPRKTEIMPGDAKANIPSEDLYNRYESGGREASALDKAYIPSTLGNKNSESDSLTSVHRYMSMNTHAPSLRLKFLPDRKDSKVPAEHQHQRPESLALQGNQPNAVNVGTPWLPSSREASVAKEGIDIPQLASPILREHYEYKSAGDGVSNALLGSQSENFRTQRFDPAQAPLKPFPNSQTIDHYVGDTSRQEVNVHGPHQLLSRLPTAALSRKLLRDVDSDAVPGDDILTEPIPSKPSRHQKERQQRDPEYEDGLEPGSSLKETATSPQTLDFVSRSPQISSSNNSISSSPIEKQKLTTSTAQGQNSVSNPYQLSAYNSYITQAGGNYSSTGIKDTTSPELFQSSSILKANNDPQPAPLAPPLAAASQPSPYPSPLPPLLTTSTAQPLVPQAQPYTTNQSSTNALPHWVPAPPVVNSSQTNSSPTVHTTYPSPPPPKVQFPLPPPQSPPSPPPSPSLSAPAPVPRHPLPLVPPPQAVPSPPPITPQTSPSLLPALSPFLSTTPSIPPPPSPAYVVPPSPALNSKYLPYEPPRVSQSVPPAPPLPLSYLPPAPQPPPPPSPITEASTTPTSPPLQSYVTTTASSQPRLMSKEASASSIIPPAPLASPGSSVPAQTRIGTMLTTPVSFYKQLPPSTTPIPAPSHNSSAPESMYSSSITMTSIPVVHLASVRVAPPILREKNSSQASNSQTGDASEKMYTAKSPPARSTTFFNSLSVDQSQTQRQQESLGRSPLQLAVEDSKNTSNAQTSTWRLATVKPTEQTTSKHPSVNGVNLTWDSASSFLPQSMESPDKISLYVPLPETTSQVNQSPKLPSESNPSPSSQSESSVLPNTTAKAPILSIEVHEPMENEDLNQSNETKHFVNAVVTKEKGFQQLGDNPESALSEDDHSPSKKGPEGTKALSTDQLAAGIEALGPTGPFSQNNSDPNEVRYGSEKFYVSAPVYNVRTAQNQSPEDAGDELNLNDMYWTDSAEEKESICKEQKGTNAVSHILCFGDSLTRGYYNKGKNHHPYTNKLQFLLNKLDTKKCYIVDNEGKDGDLASGEMPTRLAKVFQQSQVKYDWAIILGGTNDIYNKRSTAPRSAEQIFENIVSLHELAHDRGTKSVAVTIPEVNCDATETCEDVKQVREEVNDKLRKYAYTHRNAIVLSDLAGKLQRSKLDQVLIGQFFEGGLHLRPRGYERMALIIFEDLKRALS